jgi:hypothetical protein
MSSVWLRRELLVAGSAALVAVACGAGGGTAPAYSALINRFADGTLTPGRQRLPVVLGTSDGVADTGPGVLVGKVQTVDGHAVASNVHAPRHSQGGPPVLAVPARTVRSRPVRTGGHCWQLTTAFTISQPADVLMPKLGDRLPPVETPTVADHRCRAHLYAPAAMPPAHADTRRSTGYGTARGVHDRPRRRSARQRPVHRL